MPLKPQHSAEVKRALMPFSGLGFDLERTALKARSATLRVITDEAVALAGATDVPSLAGYELLTVLGREIRGR